MVDRIRERIQAAPAQPTYDMALDTDVGIGKSIRKALELLKREDIAISQQPKKAGGKTQKRAPSMEVPGTRYASPPIARYSSPPRRPESELKGPTQYKNKYSHVKSRISTGQKPKTKSSEAENTREKSGGTISSPALEVRPTAIKTSG